MLRAVVLLVPVILAACGADGPPVAPSQAAAQAPAISGEVKVGVSGGL